MAKKGSKENPISSNALQNLLEKSINPRDYKITGANIVDGYCNYSYEIIEGIGKGDNRTGKGSHVVKDDLRKAFTNMNVHLAVVDDIFKHSAVEILNIDDMHSHEFATLYNITGFQMGGSEESESIVLIGNKYVSGGGRITLKSPKIMIDNLSSYTWWNELKEAADTAREEVALYMEGKYIEEEDEIEEKESKKQGKLTFGKARLKVTATVTGESEDDNQDFATEEETTDDLSDFDNAKI